MKRPECVVSRQRAYLAILSALPLKGVIQGALEAPSACRLCARSSRLTAISSLLIAIPKNALPHVHRNQHVWLVDCFGYMQVARD